MERRLKKMLPDGEFRNVSPQRSRTMSAIRGKHTKSTERRLRMALIRAGIPGWRLHPLGVPGNPDLAFPRSNLVIFVDGCFWHGCPKCGHIPHTNSSFWQAKIERNRERDRLSNRAIRKRGDEGNPDMGAFSSNTKAMQRVVERIKHSLSAEEGLG